MRITKYLIYLSLPILCCITPNVFAGVFEPPTSDKSLEYLGMLFGSNVGTMYLGGAPNPVLAAMMQKFNVIIVAIGTIIVSYVGIVSTINTAHEGETMGKKWSSIWLPMRSMLGMLLMVPTPGSGYSMIQVTVIWAIVQGIGAADQVWNIVLDNLKQGLSAAAGLTIDPTTKGTLETKGKELAKQLLSSAVCMQSIKQVNEGATDKNGKPIPASDFTATYGDVLRLYQTTPTSTPADIATAVTGQSITYTANLNIGAKNPTESNPTAQDYSTMCGSYVVTATVSPNELSALGLTGSALITETASRAQAALEQKLLALNTMFISLKPIAQSIAQGTVTPRDPSNRLDKNKSPPIPTGYIQTAVDAYRDTISAIIKPAPADGAVKNVAEQGEAAGWVSAGSFYVAINQAQQQFLLNTATIETPTANKYDDNNLSVPSCKDVTDYTKVSSLVGIKDYLTKELKYIGDRLVDSNTYFANDIDSSINSLNLDQMKGRALSTGNAFLDGMLGNLRSLTSQARNWIMDQLRITETVDPLLSHAQLGSKIMQAAENVWLAVLAVGIAASFGAVCAAQSPFFMTVIVALTAGVPIILGLAGIIWTCGATLAVYLPMIPYMIYTITVLGWFLLVIEALIAAPIVSLGLVVPSGDELGKMSQGLMLLVNIVLRPVLMVFGFILAARLYRTVISLVNFGMMASFDSLPVNSILAPMASVILYTGFIAALANKCFALIYLLPDKIMRWIGGPGEQTDASAVQEAKQSFEKGSQEMEKGTSGTIGGISKNAHDEAKQNKKDIDDAKKAAG